MPTCINILFKISNKKKLKNKKINKHCFKNNLFIKRMQLIKKNITIRVVYDSISTKIIIKKIFKVIRPLVDATIILSQDTKGQNPAPCPLGQQGPLSLFNFKQNSLQLFF